MILADHFGVDAQWVLDPIFLLSPEHYQTLISAGSRPIPTEPYLFAYLLDIKAEDRSALELWSQKAVSGGLAELYFRQLFCADRLFPRHVLSDSSAQTLCGTEQYSSGGGTVSRDSMPVGA